MKYCSILIISILLLNSCKKSIPDKEPIQTTPEAIEVGHEPSTPIGPEYPVAGVHKVFTVKIEDTNYTPAQKEKLREAEKILSSIFNSEDLKTEILARKFTNTKGLSNLEIYEKLYAGAEALIPAVNYQMDLTVTSYYANNNTVGYTYAHSMIVNTNRKFHNSYTALNVASNLGHEWSHKIGFGHSSASDYKSVPYSMNDIIKKLGPLSEAGKLTPKKVVSFQF